MELCELCVVLTREAKDNGSLRRQLEGLGATVIENPLILVRFRSDREIRLELSNRLPGARAAADPAAGEESPSSEIPEANPVIVNGFDAMVITSANAVRAIASLVRFLGFTPNGALPLCFVVGERTRMAAAELGLQAIHPDGVKTALDLASHLASHPLTAQVSAPNKTSKPRLLWFRGQLADLQFKQAVEESGFEVTDVVCYDTVTLSVTERTWQSMMSTKHAVAVFYSPSAVRAFVESTAVKRDELAQALRDDRVALLAIGPTTHSAIMDAGFERCLTASRPTVEGVVDAILETYERGHSDDSQ